MGNESIDSFSGYLTNKRLFMCCRWLSICLASCKYESGKGCFWRIKLLRFLIRNDWHFGVCATHI